MIYPSNFCSGSQSFMQSSALPYFFLSLYSKLFFQWLVINCASCPSPKFSSQFKNLILSRTSSKTLTGNRKYKKNSVSIFNYKVVTFNDIIASLYFLICHVISNGKNGRKDENFIILYQVNYPKANHQYFLQYPLQ